jgi:hypothetical protein
VHRMNAWSCLRAIHPLANEAGIRLVKAPWLPRRVLRHDCAPIFDRD